MSRLAIARTGAIVSMGFLLAAAVANFMFGLSLGRTHYDGMLIGMVGVCAVAMNALSPFFLSWSLAASRTSTAASVILLWALCLTYSTTSAIGFAALNRESTTAVRRITSDAYEDTRRELMDLETRRKDAKAKDRSRLDGRIDEVRKRLASLRGGPLVPADAQATLLSALALGLVEARQVRIALAVLFALMVEMGATLGLFVALSHSFEKAADVSSRWKPKA